MRLFSFFTVLSLASLSFPATAEQTVFSHQDTMNANDMPSLADLLTIESSVSIFYSYARELALSELFNKQVGLKEELGRANANGGLTLLVPTNKAVMALARKPHQSAQSQDNEDIAISEEELFKQSRDNVQRWVEAHIIPTSPLTYPAPTTTYDTLLQGKSVTLASGTAPDAQSDEDWKSVTINEGIRIISMKQASNGVLYIIDGTIDVD
ncbi:hypothetical protein F5878DRAFT_728323 [Lentinula raphanica]|uniref:FAS1 domain-containing protein n=1 Tax=Lentinula raphanica TaxID=153919 RepID=A0AA38U8S6_9AGAR|nr:hypothetical protein F5878DRAFT_728323 [Lentinula raphanica]